MALIKRLVKGTALTHAELDGNFDHVMSEIAKVAPPDRPANVAFSTPPGTPTVTNTGITETASVVNNNGTSVNIPSTTLPYALAAAGKKRRDAIIVDYAATTPTYVRVAGTEVASTDVAPTPSIPANRLFVRYLDITDGAAGIQQNQLDLKANKAGDTFTGTVAISKNGTTTDPHFKVLNPAISDNPTFNNGRSTEAHLNNQGQYILRNLAGGGFIVRNAVDNATILSLDNAGVLNVSGGVTLNGQPLFNGSETKLSAGTNITISGAGTTASPYVITSSASAGTTADGSETKVTAGSNITISGLGTAASPYVITGNVNAVTVDQTIIDGSGNAVAGNAVFDALTLKADIAAVQRTGTSVLFDVPATYGSEATPEIGNITVNMTGWKLGVIQEMIHKSGTAPNFGAGLVAASNSGSYVVNSNNYIYFNPVSATKVRYFIAQ